MTIGEKQHAVRAYCDKHSCGGKCAVYGVALNDYSLDVTPRMMCYSADTDDLLDKRLAAIEAEAEVKRLAAIEAEAEVKREFTKVALPTETSLKDAIHPHHYKLPGGMQVIDVEVAMFGREAVMHHCLCTAAEYILRSRQKNGVEDIKKAHWWLCEYLELEAEGK